MAVSTYAELQSAMQNWLARSDSDIITRIPEFIALNEAPLNRELRVRRMEQRAYATTVASQDFYAWPTDLLEVREIHIDDTSDQPLIYLTPQQMRAVDNGSGNAVPIYWSDVQGALQLWPVPTASNVIAIDYYKRLALATDLTNWLLTYHPDAYLYGSLMQAAPYLGNDARISVWAGLAAAAVESITKEDLRIRHGVQPLQIRSDNPGP